jgi:hypothetical protein
MERVRQDVRCRALTKVVIGILLATVGLDASSCAGDVIEGGQVPRPILVWRSVDDIGPGEVARDAAKQVPSALLVGSDQHSDHLSGCRERTSAVADIALAGVADPASMAVTRERSRAATMSAVECSIACSAAMAARRPAGAVTL